MLGKIKEYAYLVVGALIFCACAGLYSLRRTELPPAERRVYGTIVLNALGVPVSGTVPAVNLILFAVGL